MPPRSFLIPALVAGLVGAGAAPARAQTAIASDVPPAPPAERRIDTRIGMLVGGAEVGDVDGPSSGLHTSLGYRVGPVQMMAEYQYLSIGDSDTDSTDRDGRMTRGGVTLRYELADVARTDSPVGLQFWAEAGAGAERTSWDHGGVLYRPDLAFGFGFEIDGRGWRKPRPRHFGAYLAMRALLARAPSSEGPAMCEGPCSVATAPSRNDVTVYFHFGLHWGR